MSDPTYPHDPADAAGTPEPEYLGPAEKPARSGRRTAVVGIAAAAVVGAVGVGGWGVLQLMSSGTAPATAVPADAIGYLGLDLDPSAGQKIDAIRTLKKFPGLAEDLDLGSRDDIRRWVFDQIQEDEACTGLDYERDVASWLGNRVAFAAVPGEGTKVVPLVVLQSTDEDAARAGLDKLAACDDSGDLAESGIAFTGDYVVITEHQADADRAVRDAEAASLADDADFQKWTAAAGDPGIVTAYASADAPQAVLDMALGEGDGADALPPKMRKQLREAYSGFQGMAGVVRFDDGGVELEMAVGGESPGAAPILQGNLPVQSLPQTTAAFLSMAVPDGFSKAVTDGAAQFGAGGGDVEAQLWQPLEAQTGLQLPEDLETLLGDSLTLSVDSSIDIAGLEKGTTQTAPVALRIEGDTAGIKRVVNRLRSLLGPEQDRVVVTESDGSVVVGIDRGYVTSLADGSGESLGDSDRLATLLPEVDRASFLAYVDFDSGDGWAERLADEVSGGDASAVANVKPLDALGVSMWYDDDVTGHMQVTLTTD